MPESVRALPKSAWVRRNNSERGSRYVTEVVVAGQKIQVLCDGGSEVSCIDEGSLMEILLESQSRGVRLDSEDHPVKQLEKWPKVEEIQGISGGRIPLLGAVVLKVHFVHKETLVEAAVLLRLKICKGKGIGWPGVVLGAGALECQSNGGLGFVPDAEGFLWRSLDVITRRVVNESEKGSPSSRRKGVNGDVTPSSD